MTAITSNPEAHDYAAWADEEEKYCRLLRQLSNEEFAGLSQELMENWQKSCWQKIANERSAGVVVDKDAQGVMHHQV